MGPALLSCLVECCFTSTETVGLSGWEPRTDMSTFTQLLSSAELLMLMVYIGICPLTSWMAILQSLWPNCCVASLGWRATDDPACLPLTRLQQLIQCEMVTQWSWIPKVTDRASGLGWILADDLGGGGGGGALSLTLTQLADVAYDFVGERGGEWGKQVGSMNKKSQVRSCCNITFIYTNQKTVSVLEKTQANKTFRTWKQKSRLNNSNYVINTVTI